MLVSVKVVVILCLPEGSIEYEDRARMVIKLRIKRGNRSKNLIQERIYNRS